MDKIAQAVRRAEVNGFVAGLIDSGIIKVATEEEAVIVADVIEEHLPEEYDMEDAMAIAAEVIDALDEEAAAAAAGVEPEPEAVDEEGMAVVASDEEFNETAAMAAYGELSMAKLAGNISEKEFEKEAAFIRSMLNSAKAGKEALVRGAKATGRQMKAGLKGEGIRPNLAALKARMKGATGVAAAGTPARDLGKALGRTAAAYGTAGAVGAGTALGAKNLYNKYAK